MKAIDCLKDAEVLALARFIAGCKRIRKTDRWRGQFAKCAEINHYAPFVNVQDARHLQQLHIRRGTTAVCALRSTEVTEAGLAVAREWKEAVVEGSAS